MVRALVVEDEPLIREMTAETLELAGFETESAANGEEALALLNRDRDWNVLFTDIRMPGGLDGWDLGRMARMLMPNLSVIYASGYPQDKPDLSTHERFLTKPYQFNHIEEVLRSLGFDPSSNPVSN